MTVAKILAAKGRNTITIAQSKTVRDAVALLEQHGIGAVIVSDDSGGVGGIVSERDIVRELARSGAACLEKSVTSIMTSKVVTCREQDAINDVMVRMTSGKFRHMPVMEGDSLIAVISIGDVVKQRISQIESEANALREYITS